MLTDFQNSFTGRLMGKFATNSYLNIPPHLKYIATLPCGIPLNTLNHDDFSPFKTTHCLSDVVNSCK